MRTIALGLSLQQTPRSMNAYTKAEYALYELHVAQFEFIRLFLKIMGVLQWCLLKNLWQAVTSSPETHPPSPFQFSAAINLPVAMKLQSCSQSICSYVFSGTQ